jgi:alkylation response protein AidB-like acyl-CoA dehydrogenase
MAATVMSMRDLRFLLHEWLDVASLTGRERYAEHSRETFDAVLDLSADLAQRYFAPHNRAGDLAEPTFDGSRVHIIPEVKQALDAFARADLVGAVMDGAVGGGQLPHVVFGACMAWFYAANVATSSYQLLTVGNANLLLAHGSADQIETYVKPMVTGRFLGTMALSEPEAGSSLADITTEAVLQDDGTYRVFGRKMWISGGDHELAENIVHLVLAKIPGGPPGSKGISLFIVPKFLVGADGSLGERNDVVLAGINHKMGFRGTVNTAPVFGEGAFTPGGRPGAVGYLVGEPHRGLAYMFHMMNEARISVGLCAAALGYTGYLESLGYARSRTQGRLVAGRGDGGPQVPIIEHPDVRRMLLAQKAYVEGALALALYCGRLVDEQKTGPDADDRARAALLLDVLTPIAKSWPSQWCVAANDLAIQVLGGAGYTRDHDVEQHYRDNRLNPIHEGTHGIQALDLLGRKVVADGGAGLRALLATFTATGDRAVATGDPELARFAEQLRQVARRVASVTARLWAAGDAELALANATAYLEAVGHVVIAWVWLEQALAAHGKDGAFYQGKRLAARFFYRCELPRVGPQLDLLASLDRTVLDAPASCL